MEEGKGEVVTVAGARDVDGVSTTTIIVEIMLELPLQTMQLILSNQL
jgi:single-stranded DNA-specific DHH superfamily exonuclease